MALSNLQTRILSSLVLIPVVCGAAYLGEIVFDLLIFIMFCLSVRELVDISAKLPRRHLILFCGIVYMGISLFLLDRMRDEVGGMYKVIAIMLVVWGSDTFAYIFGRTIGGPKLAPAISPNKTWAGMGGAMFGATVALALMTIYGHTLRDFFTGNLAVEPYSFMMFGRPVEFHVASIVMFGAILGIVGQAGDLLESFMKRKAGMKDSGNLIPGHGGILDRIDALLLVIPVFYIILRYGF